MTDLSFVLDYNHVSVTRVVYYLFTTTIPSQLNRDLRYQVRTPSPSLHRWTSASTYINVTQYDHSTVLFMGQATTRLVFPLSSILASDKDISEDEAVNWGRLIDVVDVIYGVFYVCT